MWIKTPGLLEVHYYIDMTQSLSTTVRYALLLGAAVLLGLVTLTIADVVGAKNTMWGKLSVASGAKLADASCTVPTSSSDDIYFVSCGGFF